MAQMGTISGCVTLVGTGWAPNQAYVGCLNRLPDLRRTASWSTRDAYTDGHLAEARDAGRPGLRTRGATARAHSFRALYPAAALPQRASSDAYAASEARSASLPSCCCPCSP